MLVMYLLAMSLGLRFCASSKGGTGGGGWAHPKGANSMAASGLSYRKALVGTGLAIFLLLCMNRLRKQPSGPPFLTRSFSLSLQRGSLAESHDCENSSMSGCGLSHESAENGCKRSWVLF